MVLLNEPASRQYLRNETDVMVSVEAGLEEMLKACASSDSKKDPINFLAAWLMRHNPRHNPAMRERLAAMREAAAAQEAAEEAAAAQAMAAAAALDAEGEPNARVKIDIDPTGNVLLSVSC